MSRQIPGSIQVGLTRSKRELIDNIRIEHMADIPNAAGAFAGRAGYILSDQGIAIAAAIGAVIDFVRPDVIAEKESHGRKNA